jgi:hypothetical protein
MAYVVCDGCQRLFDYRLIYYVNRQSVCHKGQSVVRVNCVRDCLLCESCLEAIGYQKISEVVCEHCSKIYQDVHGERSATGCSARISRNALYDGHSIAIIDGYSIHCYRGSKYYGRKLHFCRNQLPESYSTETTICDQCIQSLINDHLIVSW